MNYWDEIRHAFDQTLEAFHKSPAMRRLFSDDVGETHYASLMRQIFHNVRENPQIQALATIYFRGDQRAMVRKFYGHASSEIGHDTLALNDLKALGHDVSRVPTENPLPRTVSLGAFPFFVIQNLNPVGYLGYLFFLEFMPTKAGAAYQERLQAMGVPSGAMTFLRDHMTVDLGHNRLMEQYVAALVKTDADRDAVIYAMRVTGHLYADMIEGAFAWADAQIGGAAPDWGMSSAELARTLPSVEA